MLTILCPVHCGISQITQDEFLYEDSITLLPHSYVIYNQTFVGERGYYGRYEGDSTSIQLVILESIQILNYLSGFFEPEYIWQNTSSSYWEYPCYSTNNVSLILSSDSDIPISVSFSIVEDRTPPKIEVSYERISLFRPKYNISFKIIGNFFSYVEIFIQHRGLDRFDSNGSLIWESYYWNRTLREYIILPDGEYNVTFTVYETMGRTNESVIELVKTTDSESILLLLIIGAGLFGAIGLEEIRKRRVNLN